MKRDAGMWGSFCFATAVALTLWLLLGGCASSRPEPAPTAGGEGWGPCDHSRMVRVMLVCRQTKADSVSVLSKP
jgi:hypothetical protein